MNLPEALRFQMDLLRPGNDRRLLFQDLEGEVCSETGNIRF